MGRAILPPKQQPSSIEALLRSVFGAIRRRPGPKAATSLTAERIRVITVGAAIITTMFFLMLALQREIAKWGELSVTLPLPPEQWKVAFDVADCGGPCIHGPESPLLKTASLTRADSTYRAQLAAHGVKPVWAQIQISRAALDDARSAGATVLFLGRLYAPHRIWINDQPIEAIPNILGRLIFLDLRQSEWHSPSGLGLTVQFVNSNRYAVPELTQFELGAIGFVEPALQEKLANQVAFADWARPLVLGFINLLVTIAFFAFWYHDTRKQEFLWFAGYTLIQGTAQFFTIPTLIMSFHAWDPRIPLNTLEIGYTLVLGLSFIRADPRWIRGVFALLVLAAGSSFLVVDPSVRLQIKAILYFYGSVVFAAFAALLCLGEIWLADKLPKHRQRRLIQFAAALIVVSALYAFNAKGVGSTDQIVTFQRFAHLGLTLILGAIVFTHFREITELANTNPLSRFHRDPELLGKPVDGFIMNFDLKGSGQIKEHLPDKYADVIARAVSLYRAVWLQNGGIETSTIQGDGLKVFFPAEQPNSADLLGKSLSGLFLADPIATQILQNDRLCPHGWKAKFRAIFTYGSITPVMTNSPGGVPTPQWLDGKNSPLFTGARLEEIEKEELDPGRTESLVLIAEGSSNFKLVSTWTKRRETRPGKEGKDLSFYVIKKSDLRSET